MKFQNLCAHIVFLIVQLLTISLFYREYFVWAFNGVFPSELGGAKIASLVFVKKETIPVGRRSPTEYFLYTDGNSEYASSAPVELDKKYLVDAKEDPRTEHRRILILTPLALGSLFLFRTMGYVVVLFITGTLIYGLSIKLKKNEPMHQP